ncbi:MAG: type IV pilin protein [Pseudomonadota bacterium]
MNKQFGITLIELMVVIVIVGILAAIAYPSYSNYVQQSARAEAHTNLLRMVDQQERYYIQNNAYATTAQLAYTASEAAPVYTYAVTLGTPANGFTVTATAVGSQAGDADCAAITVTSVGVRGGTSGADCW